MEPVARELLGEPQERFHGGQEWRYGTRGSLSIRIDKGTWFDNEAGVGGGTLGLIENRGGMDRSGALAWLQDHKLIEPPGEKPKRQIVEVYEYRDRDGAPLFQVVRYDPKDFRQRRPDGRGGWEWRLGQVRRVLFRLPELIEAIGQGRTVYIAEGEKGVNALASLGVAATCSPGGAGKWSSEYNSALAGADVVILPDNDEPGDRHAEQVAAAVRPLARSVRVLSLPGLPLKGDVADWIAAGGTAAQLEDLAARAPEAEANAAPADATGTDDATIARLARLSPLQYERARDAEADALGCRVGMLDRLVRAARAESEPNADNGQGQPLRLPKPEPWPDPVDGVELLTCLAAHFRRHLVLPPGAADAMALWTVHCHCFEAFSFTPRLQFKASDPGSGKSTAMELLKGVVPKPLETETCTAAFLFRVIELLAPTVLLDEADTYLREDEDMRGLVNAGVKPGGQAGRCVGDNQEPRVFSCHTPIALAGLGSLAPTIEDRAIRITMKRRLASETIQPIEDSTRAHAAELQGKAARWANDHAAELHSSRPDMAGLFNRAADRWRALYSIAEAAGGDWPHLARKATAALTPAHDDAQSLGLQLLGDIRTAFQADFEEHVAAGKEPAGWLGSAPLVERLVGMEGRPWAEMGRLRKPMTQNRLARMLQPYGVMPTKCGDEWNRVSGYKMTAFDDAFARNLA